MGASKTFRQGPGWQGVNTNRGAEKSYSKGAIVRAEGTHMSGGEGGRKGAKSQGAKSKSVTGPQAMKAGKYTKS